MTSPKRALAALVAPIEMPNWKMFLTTQLRTIAPSPVIEMPSSASGFAPLAVKGEVVKGLSPLTIRPSKMTPETEDGTVTTYATSS